MTTSNANNIVLSQEKIGGLGEILPTADDPFINPITVTISTTNDEENITKQITLVPSVVATGKMELDTTSETYGPNNTKIVDLLLKVEQRITVDGFLINNMGTNTTSITSSGASTINVGSTGDFSSAGNARIDGDTFSYTGKTSTSFTGVSGVSGDKAAGSVVSLDTNNSAEGKKADLKKLILGGRAINMLYEGSVFTVAIDKISIKRERFDGLAGDDSIAEFSVKFTAVKGVNF